MASPGNLLLFFDYVDPGSFLLERRLRALVGGSGPTIDLEPFERRPPPEPLLDPEAPEVREWMEEMARLAEREGVKLARPWLIPWTRKAHELARHAGDHGCFREVHDALFHAYLLEGRDIGRVDVLVEIAVGAGLDRMETKAALDVDVHRDAVVEGRQRARNLGVSTVPTLVWKGASLEGLPDDARLQGFLAR